MKATNIYLAAKTDIAHEVTDYINGLAMSNGFSTAMNDDELSQFLSWFEAQIQGCDEYIASNLVIEAEEIVIDDEYLCLQ